MQVTSGRCFTFFKMVSFFYSFHEISCYEIKIDFVTLKIHENVNYTIHKELEKNLSLLESRMLLDFFIIIIITRSTYTYTGLFTIWYTVLNYRNIYGILHSNSQILANST